MDLIKHSFELQSVSMHFWSFWAFFPTPLHLRRRHRTDHRQNLPRTNKWRYYTDICKHMCWLYTKASYCYLLRVLSCVYQQYSQEGDVINGSHVEKVVSFCKFHKDFLCKKWQKMTDPWKTGTFVPSVNNDEPTKSIVNRWKMKFKHLNFP